MDTRITRIGAVILWLKDAAPAGVKLGDIVFVQAASKGARMETFEKVWESADGTMFA